MAREAGKSRIFKIKSSSREWLNDAYERSKMRYIPDKTVLCGKSVQSLEKLGAAVLFGSILTEVKTLNVKLLWLLFSRCYDKHHLIGGV